VVFWAGVQEHPGASQADAEAPDVGEEEPALYNTDEFRIYCMKVGRFARLLIVPKLALVMQGALEPPPARSPEECVLWLG
jgi:hypothetical protein